jgi:hypothetical protein
MGPDGKLVLAFGSSGWCVGALVSVKPSSVACAAAAAARGSLARTRRASPAAHVVGRPLWRALPPAWRGTASRYAPHSPSPAFAPPRRLFVYYLGVVKALKAAGLNRNAYLIASSGGASARPALQRTNIYALPRLRAPAAARRAARRPHAPPARPARRAARCAALRRRIRRSCWVHAVLRCGLGRDG